jgi:spore germination cell wall hydrolase CwlJ-like protein
VKIDTARQWRRIRPRRHWTIAGLCIALLAFALALFFLLGPGPSASIKLPPKTSLPPAAATPVVSLNLPPPDLLRPISPEEALKENTERPFSGRPDTPAAGFSLKTDQSNRDRALECLTQAVYYEAATEGADGQRAVAQVVLNRMRHPAYPSTVCGVVYQGSDRVTGCQFTFTCDGSLARLPVPSLWKQAQTIAAQALAGKVFAPVGHATHYHADYVLPYWADSLDKSVQIGRHIFYRLRGGLGSSAAFAQRYGGREPVPPAPSTVAVALDAAENTSPLLAGPDPSALQAPAGELVATAEPQPQLAADAARGTLLLDGNAVEPVPTTRPRPKAADGCAGSSGPSQLRPLSANDVRAQSGIPVC